MESHNEDPEEDDMGEMAAAMGFSSFGTQGPAKKRKFNPRTDALVDGQELASLDKGGKKGQGSGGNSLPLGKPRILGVPATDRNADEISLAEDNDHEDDDHEDGDDDSGGPAYIDTSQPHPTQVLDGEEGPAYIDTSQPPPLEAADGVQSRINAILAATSEDSGDAEANNYLPNPQLNLAGTTKHAAAGLPARPLDPVPFGRSANNGHRFKGGRNELWYINYYDPSFNANPWAKLEKGNDLQPVGSWPQGGRSG